MSEKKKKRKKTKNKTTIIVSALETLTIRVSALEP
jgi:hypothetical protein